MKRREPEEDKQRILVSPASLFNQQINNMDHQDDESNQAHRRVKDNITLHAPNYRDFP